MSDESTSPKTSEMHSRLKASLRKKPTLLVLAGVAVVLLAIAAVLEFFAPAPLSFSEVSWTVDYAEDAVTYELSPHLTLTAKVTNTTGDEIGEAALPKLRCNRDTYGFRFEDGSNVGSHNTADVRIDESVRVADEYELEFERGDKKRFDGLDNVADEIAKELASKAKGIEAEKETRDAERKSRPFEFDNVAHKVEAVEEGEGSARIVRPRLTVTAKVKNPSTENRKADSLPTLDHDGKSESFESSREQIGPDAETDVTMTVDFDKSAKPQTFAFSTEKDKSAYKGLDGVAEKITKEFADVVAALPAKQAAIDAKIKEEAERKAREEAESQRQEEERLRKEEEARQQQEQEAAERKAAEQQAREQAEQDYLDSTCWITETGKKYHTNPNCSGLANANDLIETTVGEARAQNLGPCNKRGCSPR